MSTTDLRAHAKGLSIKALRDLIDQTKDAPKFSPLGDMHDAAKFEINSRIMDAENELWQARMNIQYAENAVRELRGMPLIEIHGRDGKVQND